MDRRNFIGSLLRAGAGFAILPAATTYSRLWKPKTIVHPLVAAIEAGTMNWNPRDFAGTWTFVMDDLGRTPPLP